MADGARLGRGRREHGHPGQRHHTRGNRGGRAQALELSPHSLGLREHRMGGTWLGAAVRPGCGGRKVACLMASAMGFSGHAAARLGSPWASARVRYSRTNRLVPAPSSLAASTPSAGPATARRRAAGSRCPPVNVGADTTGTRPDPLFWPPPSPGIAAIAPSPPALLLLCARSLWS